MAKAESTEKPTDMVGIYNPVTKRTTHVQRSALPVWQERGWTTDMPKAAEKAEAQRFTELTGNPPEA